MNWPVNNDELQVNNNKLTCESEDEITCNTNSQIICNEGKQCENTFNRIKNKFEITVLNSKNTTRQIKYLPYNCQD